jgi:hypothetical protein
VFREPSPEQERGRASHIDITEDHSLVQRPSYLGDLPAQLKTDEFIRRWGSMFNRFDFRKDWTALKRWLGRHKNPVGAEAWAKS